MPTKIDELFVELGLETDKQQFDQAESLFGTLQTKALQFGAIIGGGLGLQELTFGFSEANAELRRFGEVFSVDPNFVSALGFAFQQVGGDAEDAFSSIERVANLIEDTEWGAIPSDAFRIAGFDPRLLDGVTSVAEAFERLTGATQGLSAENARRALKALGFGDAEIRLFRGGQLNELLREGRALRPVTDDLLDQAVAFDESINRLTRAMGGIADEISGAFVGDLSRFLDDMTGLLRENREAIGNFADAAIPPLKGIATGVGTLVALRLGRAALGAFANVPGAVALAAGIGVVISNIDFEGIGEATNARRRAAARERIEELEQRLEELRGVGPGDRPEAFERQRQLLLDQLNRQRDLLDEVSFRGGGLGGSPAAGGLTDARRISIAVDARGSTDRAGVELAARRGVEQALSEMTRLTVGDFRTAIS